MFRIVEDNSVMDSRKKLICGKCAKEHIMFSYAVRECLVCKEQFPNTFLIIGNKSYRINYHLHGAEENKHKVIL